MSSSSSSSSKRPGPPRPSIEIVKGMSGRDKVILREGRWTSVEVYLFGAHITSWKNNDHGQELLFSSIKDIFDPARAKYGGIPICFPQVGTDGPFGLDGFARDQLWTVDTDPQPFQTTPPHKTFVDLILRPSEENIKFRPDDRWEFRLRISLGPEGDLMIIPRIRNVYEQDGKPFSFTIAFPAYFDVSDVGEVRVEGLETQYYLDKLQQKERFTEQGDAITFESEIDRIYLSVPSKIAVIDHERRRTYVIRKEGLQDAVVWNPWEKKSMVWNLWKKKSKAMEELDKDDYKCMVCVGAAAIENPITIKPGQEWTGRIELSLANSSYNSGELDPAKVLMGN